MARRRKHDGCLFRREEPKIWWMQYGNRDGTPRRKSTYTEDWDEAQKRPRDRQSTSPFATEGSLPVCRLTGRNAAVSIEQAELAQSNHEARV